MSAFFYLSLKSRRVDWRLKEFKEIRQTVNRNVIFIIIVQIITEEHTEKQKTDRYENIKTDYNRSSIEKLYCIL